MSLPNEVIEDKEKRVFYIDTGNLPKEKAEAYMKEVIKNLREKEMSLQNKIEADMREAMKEKNASVGILKYIVGEFSRRPNLNIPLTDDEVISLIQKYLKGVEETIKVTGKETEEQKLEKTVLSAYLPKMATEEEIKEWIVQNIELSENPQARMKSMSVIMKHFGKTVDGNTVKRILMEM